MDNECTWKHLFGGVGDLMWLEFLLDYAGSGYGLMAGACEYSNKFSDSVKSGIY